MRNGIKMQFVNILNDYICTNGLSQNVFAKMIHKGEAYASSLLHGKENISADKMDDMANKLGLELAISAENRLKNNG